MHQVSLEEFRQLNDGQVAVRARCCGEKSTDSFLTMAASVVNDPTEREASIQAHCERIAVQHEAMNQALASLPKLVGTVKHINVSVPSPAPAPAQPAA
jgi:hypothetical protein